MSFSLLSDIWNFLLFCEILSSSLLNGILNFLLVSENCSLFFLCENQNPSESEIFF